MIAIFNPCDLGCSLVGSKINILQLIPNMDLRLLILILYNSRIASYSTIAHREIYLLGSKLLDL